MLEFYNSKYVKARKDHKCDLCGGLIKKDTIYHRYSGKYNGDFFDNKYHKTCQTIINTYCDENNDNEYDVDSITDWLHDKHCYDCKKYEDEDCDINLLICSKIIKFYTL